MFSLWKDEDNGNFEMYFFNIIGVGFIVVDFYDSVSFW